VRYEAARAATTAAARTVILAEFASATDDWTRSALIAGAKENAAEFISAALAPGASGALAPFVAALAPAVLPPAAARLIQAAVTAPGPIASALLRGLVELADKIPALDAATSSALQKMIDAPDTVAPALLLAAKTDKSGALAASMQQAVSRLLADFSSAGVAPARRAEIALSLLALPSHRADAFAKIGALLADSATPEPIKKSLLATVGDLPAEESAEVLIAAFVQSKSPLVFDQILKNPTSARALIAAVKDNRISAAAFGPGDIARLRTHPNTRVTREAGEVFAAINPPNPQKDELIAKLLADLSQPGNPAAGRMVFAAACAICHKLGDVGLRDVGPPLAGIGSHPTAELLAHIVDPNRQVEPNYWQWNITNKKGDVATGVIVNENAASITLRNQGGDTEIKLADIATRENTRRSLMPEGFEALGAKGLRDLIAYLVANAQAPATTSAAPAAVAPAGAVVNATPKSGGRGDFPLPEPTPIVWEPGKTRVLIISGGSSHKFSEYFGVIDGATLRAAGFSVNYTEDRDQAAAVLAEADVALISVNRKFFDTPEYRKALFAFAAAGKGIVMHHPGTWYGYAQWPELNAQIVGGGARGHDKIAKYSVNALKPAHPIMKNVPASFEVEDELYYINAEPEKIPPGTAPIEVLAETSPSVKFKAPHPAVWITSHPKARIVGLTIGHDGRVHDLPAFKTLLTNAVRWASGK
jgi:putative heme-binding domain-containing protein